VLADAACDRFDGTHAELRTGTGVVLRRHCGGTSVAAISVARPSASIARPV
jgi:hypothetical protein